MPPETGMRVRSSSALSLQREGVLVDRDLDLLAVNLQLGLEKLLMVPMPGLEQPPQREFEQLEPLGSDLAIVLGGLRPHRDDPEQLPCVPAKLQPAVLADRLDPAAVVADEFLPSYVVVQRVAGRQVAGAAAVDAEDPAPDRLALRVADVDAELPGWEAAIPDDARRHVRSEGEPADRNDSRRGDLRPALHGRHSSPNDPVHVPAHAGETPSRAKPHIAWPVTCNVWFKCRLRPFGRGPSMIQECRPASRGGGLRHSPAIVSQARAGKTS